MRYRKLRIAWSIGCGIACVLLIVLRVRSLKPCDLLYKRDPDGWKKSTLCSSHGTLSYDYVKDDVAGVPGGWHYIGIDDCGRPVQSFAFNISPAGKRIRIPDWLPLIFCSAAAIGPWLHGRFSLRTLLITITFIAVALGVIVAVLRWSAA